MVLTTAEKYLLLTERIGKKPMLRTRFTSQSYFVLAAFLDLVAEHTIQLKEGNQVTFDKTAKLPDYLSVFVKQLTEALTQDRDLESALKPITSWDIANQIYDGIGNGLLASGQVERVIFQNNLKPHVIYEPTEQARVATRTWLVDSISTNSNVAALNLFAILRQMDGLKWVVTDEQTRTDLDKKVTRNSDFRLIQKITEAAAEVITQKRFWLDSWLS
mgnify:FL=1